MTPPPDPSDAELFRKIPVPPEVVAWARATTTEEETLALLVEAQTQGGYTIDDLLPMLEAIIKGAE